MADRLTVKIERAGPDPRTQKRVAQVAAQKHLGKADHRLLAFEVLEPERKTAKPRARDRFRATYYDYTNNRAVQVEGRLDDPGAAVATVSARQPRPTAEEFAAAVALLRKDPKLGGAIRDGTLQPYPPMPPLVVNRQPDGSVERTVAVGLLPGRKRSKGVRHEIVAVNLIRRSVERQRGGAPLRALAAAGLCGVPLAAGQQTTGQGVPGQVWVDVYQGKTLLWHFLVVRPSASSGASGSAIELRYVDYRGKRVLYQAHVPILNVRYDGDLCGPYRDWQYQEGMIQASGKNVGPGFLLCPSPAKTILESGTDKGTFLGTAVYVDGLEVVLVSELEAGWYRYVSEWRLRADGTIKPRFGFDATSSSCVCNKHHHHVYWRLDFDIVTPGGNEVREFNDPAIVPEGKWHTLQYEHMRLRDPAHQRRWRVEHAASGLGYEIVSGANDGTAAGDAYAVGDVWLLRYHPGEIDDEPPPDTSIHIDKFNNREPLVNQDVVVWYGAHFTHDVKGPEVSHVVGPELRPHGW